MLAVVADGMGGHSSGDVASRLATEVVGRALFASEGEPEEALRLAFQAANREVYERSADNPSLLHMGTTCTALLLRNGEAHVAHVGDSRLYLLRGGEIFLMTEDDSAVMEMVKAGLIDREEARVHEDRNVIVRAMGTQGEVEVSSWKSPLRVLPGDCFVLSTDGLHDLLTDEEIGAAVLAGDPRAATEVLVETARERGGHDNITVAVVRVDLASDRGPAPQTREVPRAS